MCSKFNSFFDFVVIIAETLVYEQNVQTVYVNPGQRSESDWQASNSGPRENKDRGYTSRGGPATSNGPGEYYTCFSLNC